MASRIGWLYNARAMSTRGRAAVVFDGTAILVDGVRRGGLHAFLRREFFPRLAHGAGWGSSSSKAHGARVDAELGLAVAAGLDPCASRRPETDLPELEGTRGWSSATTRIWKAVTDAGYAWKETQVGVATPPGAPVPVATFVDAVLETADGGVVIAEVKTGGEGVARDARRCPKPVDHLRQVVTSVGHVQVAATAAMYASTTGTVPVGAVVVRHRTRPGGGVAVLEQCAAARRGASAVSVGCAVLGMEDLAPRTVHTATPGAKRARHGGGVQRTLASFGWGRK